jgi:dihydrofolate synthase/folylpolyglutamate synthase
LNSDAWDAFSRRLFDQNRFAIKLGLDNIRRAFRIEQHPERAAPAIVVGGTNGKGSTSAYLGGILKAHGLRVGLYTSPHLVEVRERFRVDGRPVSRERVLEVGRYVLERYGAPESDPVLTFFELTTLMAAIIFRDADVDVVIWEVGLGGRLDAVNAVEPSLTVITNIGLDHQKYLGDTVAEVAAEKAGLRRPSVPLILGPQTHSDVAPLFDFDETRPVPSPSFDEAPSIDWERGFVRCLSATENRATARKAAAAYLGDDFDGELAEHGLARTRWPGRMDPRIIHNDGIPGRFLLDAAHNPAGTGRLYDLFDSEPPGAVVVGAMSDKDHARMFSPLARFDVPVFLAPPESTRSAPVEVLRASMKGVEQIKAGSSAEMFAAASVHTPYTAVFGSIYLLGEWFAWAGMQADDLSTWVDG